MNNKNNNTILTTTGTDFVLDPNVSSTSVVWPASSTQELKKCSKCKKDAEVHIVYNWSYNASLNRVICKKCHTKVMDKLYGLDNNVDVEEVLYGKKD